MLYEPKNSPVIISQAYFCPTISENENILYNSIRFVNDSAAE
jgi:hypothetical protein